MLRLSNDEHAIASSMYKFSYTLWVSRKQTATTFVIIEMPFTSFAVAGAGGIGGPILKVRILKTCDQTRG